MAKKIDSEEEYERRRALLEKHEQEESDDLKSTLTTGMLRRAVLHFAADSEVIHHLVKKDES